MVVEVVDKELKDYRYWLCLVYCGLDFLSSRNSPLVAVKARVADVGKHVTLEVPSESFVWWWCYYIVLFCSRTCAALWGHVLLGDAELAICGDVEWINSCCLWSSVMWCLFGRNSCRWY